MSQISWFSTLLKFSTIFQFLTHCVLQCVHEDRLDCLFSTILDDMGGGKLQIFEKSKCFKLFTNFHYTASHHHNISTVVFEKKNITVITYLFLKNSKKFSSCLQNFSSIFVDKMIELRCCRTWASIGPGSMPPRS